ncbi:ER membrane protein complex subunit 1-like [Acropora millepora]|uniref:ER membrane protein complex subunit 1-like n=1 Tax=Acropora millepora TaxID=45264 RepID=UPI001CF5EFC3|nr:ER membrane protein complex subunit 1-like [Acropora millepora]
MAAFFSVMCFLVWINLKHCVGLYEDQVGLFDWRQSYLGKVKFSFFDVSAHSSKRLFVGTESNVIAALNSRTGSIIWRQVLEEKEGKLDTLLNRESTLISSSNSGKFLRSWDTSNGALLWESIGTTSAVKRDRRLPFHGWNGVQTSLVEDQQNELVVVLTNNAVKALSLQDGSEKWGIEDIQHDVEYFSFQYSNGFIYFVGVKNDLYIVVQKVNAKNGKLSGERSIRAPWISNGASCIFVKMSNLVCLETLSNSIHVISLIEESAAVKTVSFSSLGLEVDDVTDSKPTFEALGSFTNSWDGRSEILLKLSKSSQAILKLNDDLSLTVVTKYKDHSLLSGAVLGSKAVLVSMTLTDDSSLEVQCYDLNTKKVLSDMTQKVVLVDHGDPEQAVVYLFSKKENEIGYRVLLATRDHAVSLIQFPGRIMWSREEALAAVTAVDVVELPFSPSQQNFETLQEEFGDHSNGDVLSMFIRRIRAQVKQFQVLVKQFQAFVKAQQEHGFLTESANVEEELLTRDQFNLRKLIVLVTSSGKLFGLNSADGSIVWKYFLPSLAPFTQNDKQISLLYTQRTVAHFPLTAQCVVLGKSRTSEDSLLHVFNPITGKPIGPGHLKGNQLPYKVVQSMLLPHTDAKHTKLLLLLDSALNVHVFPRTAEAVEIVSKAASSIFFFLADKENGALKGYMLLPEADRSSFPVREMWNVKMPSSQQTITNIATKNLLEHVHSQGKVLGDRRVLYKYLNPNLIAVGTEVTPDTKPGISIYLMDAVTGLIVFHARHKNAKGPLHMVHSENWLVYCLFNTKSRRYELTVLEMYDGYKERNSSALSSFDSPSMPMVLQQSYIFPTTIRTASVTITERGITHKNLLFGLQTGYILSLPKNFLDPRRKFVPDAQDREEGLHPYVPELILNPLAFINYNQTVSNINGIYTSGSGLESTCLVFAYGLDLFWTRVTPSRMFDVLKEDFDYWFIVGTLGILVLVTIVSQRLASIKMLRQAWQ